MIPQLAGTAEGDVAAVLEAVRSSYVVEYEDEDEDSTELELLGIGKVVLDVEIAGTELEDEKVEVVE